MSEDEQNIEPNPVEQWVYLGQRVTGTHAWRDKSGQILDYKKLPARVVGGLYEVEVKRTGTDNVSVFPATLRYIGRSDAEDVPTIQARALAWEMRRTANSLEKRTSRLAEIDEAMAPLVALAGKVIGFANREALAKYVVSKIYQA